MLEQALNYLSYGLQAIPAAFDKRPLGKWTELQKRLMTQTELSERFAAFSKDDAVKAVGFLTGKVSGGLEVVDVDTKYESEGTDLYAELKQLIDDNLPDLAGLFTICRSRSGGYHIYYRCADIAGNQKLARRPTTDEEQLKKPGEKIVVLIETRGEGGFIVAPPTPGYSLLQGSFESIPEITPEQRSCLLSICRNFNEEAEPEPVKRPTYQQGPASAREGLSPFVDYNQRGDIIELLERHGWSTVGRQGQRIHLKRPGQSDTKTSGNFHEGLRKLFVFSSSTVFEPEKGYSPSDAFVLLECNGDKKEAYRRLLSDGYGTAGTIKERVNRVNTGNIRVEASDSNGEGENLSEEDVLTEERVKSVVMDAAYIYYTKNSPKLEIIQALDLIERNSPVKVYLLEVASLSDTSSPIQKLRPSEFKAVDIMKRYAEVYHANSEYVDPETEDAFIEEFIQIRQALTDPFEIDRFRALWLDFSSSNNLSITEQSIKAVEDKLTYNKQREEQNRDFSDLLEKAAEFQKKGNLTEALKVLATKSREIGTKDKAEAFKILTTPIKEATIAEQLRQKPDDIKTGYILGDSSMNIEEREIRLPAGAISIVAGATSHGKTAVLLNLALKAASELPDKNIYVLGYEENGADMTIRAMNAFIGANLGANNRRIIASHYKGDNSFFKGNSFKDFATGKEVFFETLIEPGKLSIQYVDYDSDTLIGAIDYLHKHGNAGGVFIDYMQLLRKSNWKNTRQEELKQICLDLKDVAVDTGLPIILAAQFTRKVINPLKLHPTEIGEAGDIERIANVIIGIWNNDKKMLTSKEDTEAINQNPYYRGTPGLMYFELLKNRGGRPDLSGMLSYDGNTGVIKNIDNGGGSSRMPTENSKSIFQ